MKHASVVPAARILVIEDNASDVFLLDRALKQQDLRFELIHLLSGGEALAFIRRQGAYADAAIPDLILMDLNLSKYTGEDILREIRAPGTSAAFQCACGVLPGPGGTRRCSRTSGSPIHHQACRSGSIHGDRQDHQGSARGSQGLLTVVGCSPRLCASETALQFSQLAGAIRPSTGADPGSRMARRVLSGGVPSSDDVVRPARKAMVAFGKEERQASARRGRRVHHGG